MKKPITDSKGIFAAMRKRRVYHHFSFVLLLLITLFLALLSLVYGHTVYSLQDTFQVLFGGKFVPGASFTISVLRLPRMLAGLLAGFAFGIAGYTFQTMLHNPLANPDVLGVTSGSSCVVVICILLLHTTKSTMFIASVFAGVLTVIILFSLSNHKGLAATRVIIIGIGLQAFYNAIISYLTITGDQRDLPEALRWLNGSLDGMTTAQLPLLTIVVILLTPIVLHFGRRLQVLRLGDEMALSLGINVNWTKGILLGTTVVMTAVATAVTGPIAFVSFLAGPLTDRFMEKGRNNALAAGMVGASLVLVSDLIGQYAFPYRFPVGVITGLIGAPYLIWQLIWMSKRGGV